MGDWVVFDKDRVIHVLERQSLFPCKAAGSALKRQLVIAAQTLIVVLLLVHKKTRISV